MEKKEVKILITGSNGFIAKNLTIRLKRNKDHELMLANRSTDEKELKRFARSCDAVFHLAGVNRPEHEREFWDGNVGYTLKLLDFLKENQKQLRFIFASSIQAKLDNPYGRSKLAAEQELIRFAAQKKSKLTIFRLPNVFGKWCRPNYNSAIATFCHNIANGLPIQVNDPSVVMNLVYIDDVVAELVAALNNQAHIDKQGYSFVPAVHTATLGEIAELLYSFKNSREDLSIPDMAECGLTKKLYATYLSYLPTDSFCYPLKVNKDERGSFTEIIRTADRGQFSVNISKPGITKGEHWHHTKNEKFVVVSGKGLIQFRKIDSDEVIEYHVSGEKLEVVDIPPGYTHNIINEGSTDLVTFMWCSECFHPERPDTYSMKV